MLQVVVRLTSGGDTTTDDDGSDREIDRINRDHHIAAEFEDCLSNISTLSASEACDFSTDTASTLTVDDPNEIYDFLCD